MKQCLLILSVLLLASCSRKVESINETEESKLDNSIAYHLKENLGDSIIYDWAERSFSPHYSNTGIVFSEYPGLVGVYFHYNYKCRPLKHIIELQDNLIKTRSDILGVTQVFTKGQISYAYYDENSFLIEIIGYDTIALSFSPNTTIPVYSRNDEYSYSYKPWVETKNDYYSYRGYMQNKDRRDPDPFYPFAMGVKILDGQESNVLTEGMKVAATGDRILLAMNFQSLELSDQKMHRQLAAAPTSIAESRDKTADWLAKAVGDLPLTTGSKREQQIAAKAAMALTFNACKGPGYFQGKVATFPNRGNYAVQFEWDASFQNLAYEMMDERLAEDAISILTDAQRPDGKMGQFVASTYLRPTEIQVPLIGWATERLYKSRNNTAFVKGVLPLLAKNTEWIMNNRMTSYGLTSALSPWELWDDTPRLDRGPILACDFNADLLMQIRACEYMAREVGNDSLAAKSKQMGDVLAEKIVEYLYDEEANIFRDMLVASGERLSIITPANFIPLLASVPIPDAKAKAMIQTYLLDTTKMFGSVPFPSVAYDEPTYNPHKPGKPDALTWRGPTWMPIAWMMMEILKKHEFEEEYWYAMNRIYQLMLEDGELHELFNSQTGEGIGIPQLGWTAAIFLKIKKELESNDKKQVTK